VKPEEVTGVESLFRVEMLPDLTALSLVTALHLRGFPLA
jgi:hypothetical protein